MSNIKINIKINTVNTNGKRSSATVSVRLARAYLTICTNITATDEHIRDEMQRIANYETFRDARISDTALLEDFLLTRIEDSCTDQPKLDF